MNTTSPVPTAAPTTAAAWTDTFPFGVIMMAPRILVAAFNSWTLPMFSLCGRLRQKRQAARADEDTRRSDDNLDSQIQRARSIERSLEAIMNPDGPFPQAVQCISAQHRTLVRR